MTLSEEITQIRRIQLLPSRPAVGIFAGEYRSSFKGKGLEFDQLREYQPGDDVRSIDWNVTARSSSTFVRQFVEERELTVMILLDISPSFSFGTSRQLKSRTATEVVALLAGAAIRNNDKVGLLLFTDRIELYVPPKKGNRQLFKLIREALFMKPVGKGTDIAGALEYFERVTKQSALLFLISDYTSPVFSLPLLRITARHDLVAIAITDPAETDLPEAGVIMLEEPETGERFLVDTDNPRLRHRYQHIGKQLREQRRKGLHRAGADFVEITPDDSYFQTLVGFFRQRGRRVRR